MKFLKNISFLTIAVIAYHALVLTRGTESLDQELFQLTLLSKEVWTMSYGNLLIAGSVALLYVEILKSTRTSQESIMDHAFSLLLFIACLVEFLIVDFAGTSTFFLITLMMLLDVVGGFTITISGARRDFGGGSGL